jgi:2-oxoglutarate dehydrogenase E2 component (dihydrolipoamide succinyltransferase)
MAIIELKMPKMGESISEATIINWLYEVGDSVDAEETILEVATDKVDSEVPSPCSGVIKEILFKANDIVPVGTVMALIEAEGNSVVETLKNATKSSTSSKILKPEQTKVNKFDLKSSPDSDAFLSPLVLSIAQKEGLTIEEVQSILGTGTEGRIRKSDVMNYISNRKYALPSRPQIKEIKKPISTYNAPPIKFIEGHDTVIEMDRMRKMIADHMVYSKHTSPHVTAYIEVDVTNLVNWRNDNKVKFQEKYNERLTFTPIFVEAVSKSIEEFPGINASIDGNKIIQYKDVNVGMATALPSGNLIVPVVKNANEKDLLAIAKDVNHLANSSRNNSLKPQEIQGSTFTISNVGTFGSLMGTPIINQPEVAILAIGIIKKRAEVISTEKGDELAIRSMMYLSLSFDHRAVDGYLGGSFLRKVGDYLEQFDIDRKI